MKLKQFLSEWGCMQPRPERPFSLASDWRQVMVTIWREKAMQLNALNWDLPVCIRRPKMFKHSRHRLRLDINKDLWDVLAKQIQELG